MATETTVTAKFVSQKISKVRWQPSGRQIIGQQSTVFAAGSWDDGRDNSVSVWQIDHQDPASHSQIPDGEPSLLCSASHHGDVTDLHYITPDTLLVSSSLGDVAVYRHHLNSQTVSRTHGWDALHRHTSQTPCPCTAVATRDAESFVSVGEDGRLAVVNLEHKSPTRVIERADSCTLNAVTFIKQSEVATVNTNGQLKLWDVRQSGDEPARVFLLSGERVPLNCVDKHPTQPHIVATGGQDGTLCIWDMRQQRFPVTLLSAHSADMWEVKFHPSQPNNLFSCSEDGSVWHWDRSGSDKTASVGRSLLQPQHQDTVAKTTTGAVSPWLSSEASRQGLDITDLLPGNTLSVNSLDIAENTLLCGTDGEVVSVVHHVAIR